MGLWKKGILLTVIFVGILSGYAFGGEKVISEINAQKSTFIKADQEGELWGVYYDPNSGIRIHKIGAEKDLLLNGGKEGVSSGLAFDVQKGHLLAVWREKSDAKRLFLRASHDNGKTLSEPVLLDIGTTSALSRIEMGSNVKGEVVVEWLGEAKAGKDKYHLHAACSDDFGKTFSKPINLTLGYSDSLYPALLVDDKGTYVFSYSTREMKRYMLFRKTLDGCKTWSDPLLIKEIGVVTLFIKPVKVGNRLHVFWFNSYDGIPVTEGAYSDDDGLTWKTTVLESTKGFDTGIVSVAYDSKGHIYIALSGIKTPGEKQAVFLVRSEDNGATWSDMIPIRQNTSKSTKAYQIIVRAEDDGTVIAVWIDQRNIRSNIYMQYSKDFGKTWQEKDIALEEPGRFNTAFFPYTVEVIKVKDKYYLLAHRFRADDLSQADMLLLDFTIDGGVKKK